VQLDFWKKCFNREKNGILWPILLFFWTKMPIFPFHSHGDTTFMQKQHTTCEWILHTLPQTVRSTEDPETIVTVLVAQAQGQRSRSNVTNFQPLLAFTVGHIPTKLHQFLTCNLRDLLTLPKTIPVRREPDWVA